MALPSIRLAEFDPHLPWARCARRGAAKVVRGCKVVKCLLYSSALPLTPSVRCSDRHVSLLHAVCAVTQQILVSCSLPGGD